MLNVLVSHSLDATHCVSAKSCTLVLPQWLRRRLREPLLGSTVYPNLPYQLLALRDHVTVGDIVTSVAWRMGLRPRIAVYDCRSARHALVCPEPPENYKVYRVSNPASTLTYQVMRLVDELIPRVLMFRDEFAAIVVDGEEDLVALYLAAKLPSRTLLVYGQPMLGVTVIDVNDGVKEVALMLLSCFELSCGC